MSEHVLGQVRVATDHQEILGLEVTVDDSLATYRIVLIPPASSKGHAGVILSQGGISEKSSFGGKALQRSRGPCSAKEGRRRRRSTSS